MDLVVSVKAARTAARFVEGGALEEALSELNLGAARIALRSADLAVTPEAQVRSAVTHLEAAKAAAVAKLQKRRLLRNLTRIRQVFIDGNRLRYINGLLAICYRYLGEERLAEQSLALAKSPDGMGETQATDAELWTILAGMVVSLFTAIEEDFINVDKYRVDGTRLNYRPVAFSPEPRRPVVDTPAALVLMRWGSRPPAGDGPAFAAP
jgi:hypothetical protein